MILLFLIPPGPDMAYMLAVGLESGRRSAVKAILGIGTGMSVYATAVVIGVGKVTQSHPVVLDAVKVCGAFYLLWLAYATFRGVRRMAGGPSRESIGRPYLQGVMVSLTNPKVLLFFLSVLPQFVGNAQNAGLQLAMLGAVNVVISGNSDGISLGGREVPRLGSSYGDRAHCCGQVVSTDAIAKRRKRAEQLARMPGVRTIERRLEGGNSFSLAYTRTGPEGGLPVLVIPGGPGLASVLPYRGLRTKSRKLGIDLIMMEHRGVGLSRTDQSGFDLPPEAIAVHEVLDDAAAILDAEGIDQVLVYGASYGSYLAQGFGVKFPDRVAGMILDSAMTGTGFDLLPTAMLKTLFWDGTPATRRQAETVRRLVNRGTVDPEEMFALQFLYEFGGLPLVDRMLALLDRGRGQRVWQWINRLGTREIMSATPFVMEFDLVGEIAFRELGYAPTATEAPLKTGRTFGDAAQHFSPFEGEPFNLVDALPEFSWPTVVISGNHDVRTPQVAAEHITALIPDATLLAVRNHGHSALDTHPELALEVTRAVAGCIHASGTIDPARLPSDPHGSRGLMHRIVSARLHFARFCPRSFS